MTRTTQAPGEPAEVTLDDLFPGAPDAPVTSVRTSIGLTLADAGDTPPPGERQGRTIFLLGMALVGVLIFTALALLLASRPVGQPATARPPAGVTGTAGPRAVGNPGATGGSESGQGESGQGESGPAALPAGAQLCSSDPRGGFLPSIGNEVTSCPFATAVLDAWVRSETPVGDEVRLDVMSPVTARSYAMTCIGAPPIVCVGGENALVYLVAEGD